jgi:hypothetical protein
MVCIGIGGTSGVSDLAGVPVMVVGAMAAKTQRRKNRSPPSTDVNRTPID